MLTLQQSLDLTITKLFKDEKLAPFKDTISQLRVTDFILNEDFFISYNSESKIYYVSSEFLTSDYEVQVYCFAHSLKNKEIFDPLLQEVTAIQDKSELDSKYIGFAFHFFIIKELEKLNITIDGSKFPTLILNNKLGKVGNTVIETYELFKQYKLEDII